MNIDTIQTILNTRLKAAQQNGNSTESSLILELIRMSDEYKILKEKYKNQREIENVLKGVEHNDI